MSHDPLSRRHSTWTTRQARHGSSNWGESKLLFLSDRWLNGAYDMVIFLPFISVDFQWSTNKHQFGFLTMTSSRRWDVCSLFTWGTKQESLAWLDSTLKASKFHSCLCYLFLFLMRLLVLISVIACFALVSLYCVYISRCEYSNAYCREGEKR